MQRTTASRSRRGSKATGRGAGRVLYAPWRIEYVRCPQAGGCFFCQAARLPDGDERGWKRKLLLHREELTKISHKIRESGFTIVPLQLYFVDGRAKVEIGVARGKKEYDKRQTLREQQDKREAQRVMRERNRR